MVNYRTYLKCRIVFTSLFLIISTIIGFNRDQTIYHDVSSNIKSEELVFSILSRSENASDIYKLSIENNNDDVTEYKVYIVSDILKNNVSNNYIKYQVNDNKVKTLNMDGMIIVDKLKAYENKDIYLKIWISDTYLGNLNYDGRIIAF